VEVDARWILENSTVSWPQHRWVYCRHPEAEKRMHIEVSDGVMRFIEFIGAPGPDWRAIATLSVPQLRVGIENERINCWLDEELFSFAARQ
jgi:hypothetical protein